MRYEAFHVCKPACFIEALRSVERETAIELAHDFYIGTRDGASDLASHIKAATIIPVQVYIQNPFVNTPEDPFVELSRFYEFIPAEQVFALASKFESQLTNTNRWEEMKESHGENLTLRGLFMDDIQGFMTLPLEMRLAAEDSTVQTLAATRGFDGFIYKGMAPIENEVVYYPLNTGAIRYGSEERV